MRKLAVLDQHGAGGIGAAEDAVLVVLEQAVLHHQVPRFITDPSAVAVPHRRAREGEAIDGGIVVDREYRLAVAGRDGGNHAHHAPHGLQRYLVSDDREVVGVGACIDVNHVPIQRSRDRGSDGCKLQACSDGQY